MATANARNDRRALQRTMEAIIADSQKSKQGTLSGFDRDLMHASYEERLPHLVAELVYDIPTRRKLEEMILPQEVVVDLQEFFDEFSNMSLLRANSLEPRHTVLLVGPPGNGKTTLAEVIATELALPLLFIRYDAIVDSFLGETSNRLRRLIDWATLNPCVLFFDEFDTVGKERSDSQETGEIKRVVSTLLMQMDRLPSHAVVVCATNHPELLDRAVWRRFEVKLSINPPNEKQLVEWFEKFSLSLGGGIGISTDEFVEVMRGENMSEVEAFTLDVRRQIVLSRGRMSASQAVEKVLMRMRRRIKISGEGVNASKVSVDSTVKRVGRKASSGKKGREVSAAPQNPLPSST